MLIGFKMRFSLLLLALFFSYNSFAQHFAFGVDVPYGLAGTFKPSVEYAFSKKFSIGMVYESGIYSEGTTGNLNSQSIVYQVSGRSFTTELKYYPFVKKRRAPRGFSLGIYYRRGSFEEHYTGRDYSFNLTGQSGIPTNNRPSVNIKSQGSTSNIGVAFGYKFNAGPIIVEPLLGFGSVNGKWDSPNERNRIDPFFKDDLNDFQYSGRIEIKLGFYFPQMKNYIKKLDNVPSSTWDKQSAIQTHLNQQENLDSSKRIKLIVYRPPNLMGALINYTLMLNDSAVMKVKFRSYKIIELDAAGVYKISAKTEDEKAIQVNLEANKVYFLRCTVGLGLFLGRPKFKFVDASRGQSEVLKIMERVKDNR